MQKLRPDQKESIVLLQFGTFLEYFDLLLFVHMAVLLNELFFPKTDPHTASLIAAFSFSSTYVVRPLGALLFGYIGDHIGRKATVSITTFLMAGSCIVIATLPTYAQIGITATWIITICRMIQGVSSMGEVIGAEIYLTETIEPPIRYVAVSLVSAAGSLGGFAALAFAAYTTNFQVNWRIAFWIGACIALVGAVARRRLRETPEFVDMKRRIKNAMQKAGELGVTKVAEKLNVINTSWREPVNPISMLAYSLISFGSTVPFYFRYVYCAGIMKDTFNFSVAEILGQNLVVSIVGFLGHIVFGFLTYKVFPLKIMRINTICFLMLVIFTPFALWGMTTPTHLLILQCVAGFFALRTSVGFSVVVQHFPIFNRFKYASMLYALAKVAATLFVSFGTHYLTQALGYWGLWIVMFPMTLGFLWGVQHFIRINNRLLPEFSRKDPVQQQQAA